MNTTPRFQTDRTARWSSLLLSSVASAALFSSGFATAQSVLDTGYDPNIGKSSEGETQTWVETLSIQPGKKVIVGGHFGRMGKGANAKYRGSLGRVPDNGVPETGSTYGPYPFEPLPTPIPSNDTADPFIASTFVMDNGETLVTGNFNQIGGNAWDRVGLISNTKGFAKYYNGPPSLEGPPGRATGYTGGLMMPNGQTVLWGYWWKADGEEISSLIRQTGNFGDLNTDLAYDARLEDLGQPESVPSVWHVNRLDSGKFLVAGTFDRVASQTRPPLVKLNDNFSRDPTFNYTGTALPLLTVAQPDGKIIVAGGGIERVLADGSPDPTFPYVSVDGTIFSVGLRADGKIVIGGIFEEVEDGVGPYVRNGMALLSSTGEVDPNFNPNVEPSVIGSLAPVPIVYAVAIQEHGKIVLGGSFLKVSNVNRSRLARLTADVPAIDDLTVSTDRTTITWTRGGSAPEIYNVRFRLSTDGGSTFTDLAAPTYIGTGWSLAGLNLPSTSKTVIRATGYASSGVYNNSAGLVEKFSRPIASIIEQPESQTVAEGSMVTFDVVARSSLPITGYQWRRNGVNLVDGPNISGATTDTLQITAAMAANGGTYTVVVKTLAGNATSTGAVLKVIVAPNITTEPVDLIVGKGKTATFSVVATGTTPTYTWTGNYPVNATGKTGPKLSWGNAQLIHEGPYQVTVANLAGNDVSLVANLNVVELATVGAPAPVLAPVGTSPMLTATVNSEVPPLAHQWFRNNLAVAGGNTAALTLNNVQLAQAGQYALRATNQAGNTTGAKGELGVVDTINQKVQVQKLGGTAVFTAAAAGNGLTYQWKFNAATNINHDGVKYFLSSGGKKLTVKGLTLADFGDYTADVTGPGGMLTTAIEKLYVTTGPPVLLGPITFAENGMVGALFSKQIDDDGNTQTKPASYSMKIAPALGGLTISKTGLISGRPTKAGTFTVTVTSKNADGTSNSVVGTLTVEAIPTNAVGKFVALINRETTLNADLGGRMDLTTTSAGTYSGKLIMGSKSYSFTGGRLGVNPDGDTNTMTIGNPANVIQVKRTGLTPLTLTFNLDLGNNTISGTVSDGVNSADIDGWRNVWSSTTNPVTAGSFFLGRFNFTYQTPAEIAPDQNWPHGLGYGYAVVPASGAASVTGVLADNSAFSSSAFLGPQGQFLVFKTLYSNKGVVIGNHQIAASAAGTVSDYGQPAAVKWLRKDQAPTVSYSYGAGFDVTLTVTGSRYDQTLIPVGANVIGSNVAAVDTQIDFSDGGLDVSNPDVQFTLSAVNKATYPANPNKVSISFNKATGVISGSFSVTDDIDPGVPVVNVTRPGTFKGIILQTPMGAGTGHGFFNLRKLPVLPSTSIKTTQILSGPFTITDMP